MLTKELDFFIAHQDELVAKHRGKTLVIRGETVVGAYPSPLDAYLAGRREFPAGTFMVQPCEPGPGAYTVSLSTLGL